MGHANVNLKIPASPAASKEALRKSSLKLVPSSRADGQGNKRP